MTCYPDNPLPEIASQREVLFDLFEKRKYSEAADVALSANANGNLFMPIEAIADKIRKTGCETIDRAALTILNSIKESIMKNNRVAGIFTINNPLN